MFQFIKETIETEKVLEETLSLYKEINLLYDIGEDVISCIDLKQVTKLILNMATNIIKADKGSLMLTDEGTNILGIFSAFGIESKGKEKLEIGKGIAGHVTRTGSSEIVNDVKTDSRWIGPSEGTYSLLCVPLKTKKRIYGVINLSRNKPDNHFTARDLKLLNALASHSVTAIENIRQMEEIELNRYLQKTKEVRYDRIIGKSGKMKKVLRNAEDFSKTEGPITIIGNAGTGKELLARTVHSNSERAKFPVIEFLLPKERRVPERPIDHEDRRKIDKIECELFGNEKEEVSAGLEKMIGRLELINKGTLIIKDIENLSGNTQIKLLEFIKTGSFFRAGDNKPISSNVRIIATTKDYDAMQKQLDRELFCALTINKTNIPRLSERKKDIPHLMEYFVEKISKTKHTQKKIFSKGAINKLLKYDYPENVRELENVIERAVLLSTNIETIEEEEIFLGETDVEDTIRFNLLNVPFIKKLCESRKIILAFKAIPLIFFVLILYLLFVPPDVLFGGNNVVLILCWQMGLPLLFVSYLFFARFGCAICPIDSIASPLGRFVNSKIPIPSFIKDHDILIMGLGFVSILFFEEYTHMAYSTINTAYLIISVFFGAIIFNLIFEKSAWCRHLCPLGGLGAIFSMSSILEIRANRNTCTTICTTHDCYKGTEKVGRCPMYLHLQFLSDNRNCKFCLNCIKSCKHNSPRLNLRIPGAEIATLKQSTLTGAIMSIILSGILIAEIPFKLGTLQTNFTLVFLISILFALSLKLLSNFFAAYISGNTTNETLKNFGHTLLPLTLSGFIALKLVEVIGNSKEPIMLFNTYQANVTYINVMQYLIIMTGLCITEYLIYRLVQDKIIKSKQSLVYAIMGAVPIIFSLIYCIEFSKFLY